MGPRWRTGNSGTRSARTAVPTAWSFMRRSSKASTDMPCRCASCRIRASVCGEMSRPMPTAPFSALPFILRLSRSFVTAALQKRRGAQRWRSALRTQRAQHRQRRCLLALLRPKQPAVRRQALAGLAWRRRQRGKGVRYLFRVGLGFAGCFAIRIALPHSIPIPSSHTAGFVGWQSGYSRCASLDCEAFSHCK